MEQTFNKLDASSSNGKIRGVASGFGSLVHAPHGPSFFLPGCWTKTITEKFSTNPKLNKVALLWSHDMSAPIGRILSLKETYAGLEFEGEILTSLAKGRDALECLKQDLAAGISVGFDSLKEERVSLERIDKHMRELTEKNSKFAGIYGKISGISKAQKLPFVRLISETSLWEISMVIWGADESAYCEAASFRSFRPQTATTRFTRRLVGPIAACRHSYLTRCERCF